MNRSPQASTSTARSGVTLIELVIASFLLLLLTAATAQALRSGVSYYQRVQEISDMERDLMLLLENLRREIGETSPVSLEWEESDQALSFLTPRDADGGLLIDHANGNRLNYQMAVSYRVEGPDREMRRYTGELGAPMEVPSKPSELEPPFDAVYFAAPERPFRTLSEGVKLFRVIGYEIDPEFATETETADLSRAGLLRLEIEVERRIQKTFGVRLTCDVAPRN